MAHLNRSRNKRWVVFLLVTRLFWATGQRKMTTKRILKGNGKVVSKYTSPHYISTKFRYSNNEMIVIILKRSSVPHCFSKSVYANMPCLRKNAVNQWLVRLPQWRKISDTKMCSAIKTVYTDYKSSSSELYGGYEGF